MHLCFFLLLRQDGLLEIRFLVDIRFLNITCYTMIRIILFVFGNRMYFFFGVTQATHRKYDSE